METVRRVKESGSTYLPPAIAVLIILLYDLDGLTCTEVDFVLVFGLKVVKCIHIFWHCTARFNRRRTIRCRN
jgi:hypothetical protein